MDSIYQLNANFILSKGCLVQFIFFLIEKNMLIKTVLKSDECSEINVIDLYPKKWTTLNPNFYAEYKYSDHT